MTDHRTQPYATFAFLTYIGETLTSPQPAIAEYEADLLREGMKELGLAPDWDLVWGPLAFRYPLTLTKLYDNFMFVARKGDEYMVAVRGTNGEAKLDWVFEDFWIVPEQAWSKVAEVTPPAGLDPRLSAGTYLGLRILLGTRLRGDVPGSGTRLADYFNQQLSGASPARVMVAGHSLGGALAPTLTLYLKDTQGRAGGWDPDSVADLSCAAFAGPTPGDKDFARYLDERLGTAALRVVNPLDIVPMAWALDSLEAVPDVYAHIDHPVSLSEVERLAVDGVVDLMKLAGLDFRQYHQSGPGLLTLDRLVDYDAPSFFAQAGWQHVHGYENQLGIPGLRERMEKVFQAWCAAHPGVCPGS